jgi:hypothetical protein
MRHRVHPDHRDKSHLTRCTLCSLWLKAFSALI